MGKVSIISVIVGVTLVGLVLGLSFYNEQAEAGLSVGGCGESFGGVQLHWDKIIFEVNQNLFNKVGPKTLFPPVIFPTLTWDIKVQQDPLSATNLERTVADFLNANNYKTFDDKEVRPHFISIVDVEYDIACRSIGLTPLPPPGDLTDSTIILK